jgi:hypothetical protein
LPRFFLGPRDAGSQDLGEGLHVGRFEDRQMAAGDGVDLHASRCDRVPAEGGVLKDLPPFWDQLPEVPRPTTLRPRMTARAGAVVFSGELS